ncbi:MAG: hypothetical protein E6H07_17415 [Bacteroidetes bacterium]|nr:MAG: hypothetical protein E6H07_17415 [Bacteroidota bacterium]
MNKKLFLLILIPSLLIVGGYLFIRYTLGVTIARDGEKIATVKETDSASTKKSLSLNLRPLIIERLQQLVAKTSNNIYALSIGDMKADVLASTASFQNVVLKPDKKRADSLNELRIAPAEIFAFSFPKFEVEGINFDDILTEKTMDYKLVKLTNPVFEIYRNKNDTKEIKEDFTQRFLKEMKKLSVQNLIVEGGRIIIHNKGRSNVLKDVTINMKDILVDSATRNDRSRFLFAKKASLSFKDYKAEMSKGQYNLAIDKVNVEVPEQKLTLANLSFNSPLNKKEFSSRQKFSKEYFQFSFPSVTLNGVDWWKLVNEDEVVAKEITINSGKLLIYLDRSLPPRSKMGNFPVDLLMKLAMKINIDRLKTNDLDFAYEEYNPLSQQSGTIHVNNISMNIANVSNRTGKGLSPVTVNGNGLLMGKIPVKADFTFNRENYKSGGFTARISSDKDFDGTMINSFAMPMGMVKIEKGELQKLDANIQGDQLQASGDITVLYKDLKLFPLEKDKGEKELDKKGVTSLVANAFVLKKDNPKEGEEIRKVQAAFKRIPEGGFFMLVWKTIMTGTLKTIGAPTRIANKTVSNSK